MSFFSFALPPAAVNNPALYTGGRYNFPVSAENPRVGYRIRLIRAQHHVDTDRLLLGPKMKSVCCTTNTGALTELECVSVKWNSIMLCHYSLSGTVLELWVSTIPVMQQPNKFSCHENNLIVY